MSDPLLPFGQWPGVRAHYSIHSGPVLRLASVFDPGFLSSGDPAPVYDSILAHLDDPAVTVELRATLALAPIGEPGALRHRPDDSPVSSFLDLAIPFDAANVVPLEVRIELAGAATVLAPALDPAECEAAFGGSLKLAKASDNGSLYAVRWGSPAGISV